MGPDQQGRDTSEIKNLAAVIPQKTWKDDVQWYLDF